jgi:hypothetical protein
MTSWKRSKNGGDGGTGVHIREGTTSRVMVADRPYGEFIILQHQSGTFWIYPRSVVITKVGKWGKKALALCITKHHIMKTWGCEGFVMSVL